MTIGINAAAAIKQPRTGVEQYTCQLIKHLTMLPESREHRFFLYLPKSDPNTRIHPNDSNNRYFDFPLPKNFEIKTLNWPLPFLWTQIRLAWEMLLRPPEILFLPVHILPFFHPKNSVVTIHGLEYEWFPAYYPLSHRFYLSFSTRYALSRARKIIAISENTRRDLIKQYGGEADIIEVVYHGAQIPNSKFEIMNKFQKPKAKSQKPNLLYLGRVEQKKNIEGILAAYKILKEEYKIPHELILAGIPGYGYQKIKAKIHSSKFIIHELGYISDNEKWQLLRQADVFIFPSFYEGFGLPVLEAQAAGVPLVTSLDSCLPEIAGKGALFVNSKNPVQIAEAVKRIIDDKSLRDKLIQSGLENIKKFSWEQCARKTLKILTEK